MTRILTRRMAHSSSHVAALPDPRSTTRARGAEPGNGAHRQLHGSHWSSRHRVRGIVGIQARDRRSRESLRQATRAGGARVGGGRRVRRGFRPDAGPSADRHSHCDRARQGDVRRGSVHGSGGRGTRAAARPRCRCTRRRRRDHRAGDAGAHCNGARRTCTRHWLARPPCAPGALARQHHTVGPQGCRLPRSRRTRPRAATRDYSSTVYSLRSSAGSDPPRPTSGDNARAALSPAPTSTP